MSHSDQAVLVIGGGVSGQRAALDLAHAGARVLLVDKETSLGGTTAQLGMMFPLHNCLLCRGEAVHGPGCTRPVISSDLLDRSRPENLSVWTRSRLVAVERGPAAMGAGDGAGARNGAAAWAEAAGDTGNVAARFLVTIRREPRYVDPALCISCDRCARVCPHVMADPLQAGLVQRKAAHRPSLRSVPDSYAIDKGPWCDGCRACVSACPTAAIRLDEEPLTERLEVGAIVLASGMQLFDPSASQEYGYGRFPNVFTGLEMERMVSPAGPGEGRILRRSDGKEPGRIAWLQCVGSRDKTRDYCSAFCCGYATRQAVLARRILPSAEAFIYMMDDRVFARGFSETYDPLRAASAIRMARCRLSVMREDAATRDLLLQVAGDDGTVTEERFGMAVLSIGAEASGDAREQARILGLEPDSFGFIRTRTLAPADTSRPGIFVAGTAAGPADIADSVTLGSAAAARAWAYLAGTARGPAGREAAKARGSASRTPPRPAGGPSPQAHRIGVFACECAGEIGGIIDLERTLGFAGKLPGVEAARAVSFGCLPDGLKAIAELARDRTLTGVVIGACNRRTYAPLFERALGVPVQLASLREECAYVHAAEPAAATRKAQEIIRIAVERLRHAPSPDSPAQTVTHSALVVGGGMAGLTAALHIAEAGIQVHLVERESRLGGFALRMDRTPDGEDIPEAVQALASRAARHPKVTVHASCELARFTGHVGRFTAVLRPIGANTPGVTLEIGAAVIATGADEYRGPAYGLGALREVLTLAELGGRLRAQPGLASDTRQAVFISCAGPWDEQGDPGRWRCSRTCCETMVRQALAIRTANPACHVAVLAREVNTYGFREELFTAARKAGALFVRFDPAEPPRVEAVNHGEAAGGHKLRVTVRDTSLGETLELGADLVAVSSAILPRPLPAGPAFQVPAGADGFLRDAESKTRSFASLEPGVFICGLAQGPKPMRESVAQALAAAEHAVNLLAQERIAAGNTVAIVEAKKCAGCLTCVRVCPYGVPRVGAPDTTTGRTRRTSEIDPYRCQGCGTCASECPGKAIQLARFGDDLMLGAGPSQGGRRPAEPGMAGAGPGQGGRGPAEPGMLGRWLVSE